MCESAARYKRPFAEWAPPGVRLELGLGSFAAVESDIYLTSIAPFVATQWGTGVDVRTGRYNTVIIGGAVTVKEFDRAYGVDVYLGDGSQVQATGGTVVHGNLFAGGVFIQGGVDATGEVSGGMQAVASALPAEGAAEALGVDVHARDGSTVSGADAGEAGGAAQATAVYIVTGERSRVVVDGVLSAAGGPAGQAQAAHLQAGYRSHVEMSAGRRSLRWLPASP